MMQWHKWYPCKSLWTVGYKRPRVERYYGIGKLILGRRIDTLKRESMAQLRCMAQLHDMK